MAVKVTPARSMNTIGAKTYESATSYKRDTQGYITVLQGTKKVAEHAAGSWESVEVLDLLDAPKQTHGTSGGKQTKKAARKAGGRVAKTKTREGSQIRTSPTRSDPELDRIVDERLKDNARVRR